MQRRTIRGNLIPHRAEMIAPGRFVLVAVLLFGATFAVVTPPFQVADESGHFYRAYRVSEGRLDLSRRPDGRKRRCR